MPALSREEALRLVATGATTRIDDPASAPRFGVGDRVITRNLNPTTHTRLPRYARRKTGTIAKVHGVYALPDSNAIGAGRNEQGCYSVRFDAQELWGTQGRVADCLFIDMWDDYLDPA